MSDECDHDKARITVDGENGSERVCVLCDDVDVATLDGDGDGN